MTLKVLIAEDAPDIAEVIAFGARMTWPNCRVTIAADGREALQSFADVQPDLVILDIEMPPPNGIEVCRRIREVSRVPIMMLTVRDGTLDKIQALDLGADDYLTKPFDHSELFARLRALVRRSGTQASAPEPDAEFEDFSLDLATRELRVKGQIVRLTSTEFRLLAELVRNAGSVLPHQLLLERVWGPSYVHDVRYLKVFIRRLRQKLGDDAEQPRYIQTEWGTGYRFVKPRSPRGG